MQISKPPEPGGARDTLANTYLPKLAITHNHTHPPAHARTHARWHPRTHAPSHTHPPSHTGKPISNQTPRPHTHTHAAYTQTHTWSSLYMTEARFARFLTMSVHTVVSSSPL